MPVWKRNLYILWASQLVTMAGMGLVVPFLPFFVRELGVTDPGEAARWSGFAFSGPFFVAFFATPLWGALGDRYGRKVMVLRALFGLAAAQLLVGISQNVQQLVLFRMVQGAVSGFIAAALSLVAAGTPAAEMGFALGTLHTATAVGQTIGPVFGGVLSDLVGYRPIFFIVGALCALAGLVVFFFVKELRGEDHEGERAAAPGAAGGDGGGEAGAARVPGLADNYRFVARDPALRTLLFLVFLTQVPVAMIRPIFALFAETFSMPADRVGTLTGLAYGTLGFSVAVSAPIWGRRLDRAPGPRALVVPIAGAGVFYALHLAAPSLAWIFPVRAALGLFLGGMLPVLYSLVSARAPLARRGGIMGIASSMSILAAIVGPIAGGLVVERYGFRPAFTAAALVFAVALPVALAAERLAAREARAAGRGAALAEAQETLAAGSHTCSARGTGRGTPPRAPARRLPD